jgi:2-C-methyl-D-erythritol 4-phosphate cytidylyltransferase
VDNKSVKEDRDREKDGVEKFWAAVPAAGAGKRMGGPVPKQYQSLQGKAVLQHTLERLGNCEHISGVFLGISPGDLYWKKLGFTAEWLVSVCDGGEERADTVLRILDDMSGYVDGNDWVLVHDAARPCVSGDDIRRLIENASRGIGGLLGRKITDTVKLADENGIVQHTVPRAGLWRAQTPQMFRYRQLRQALLDANHARETITDEASAMEQAGFRPLMVEGSLENIKITLPGDLELADIYMQKQENS